MIRHNSGSSLSPSPREHLTIEIPPAQDQAYLLDRYLVQPMTQLGPPPRHNSAANHRMRDCCTASLSALAGIGVQFVRMATGEPVYYHEQAHLEATDMVRTNTTGQSINVDGFHNTNSLGQAHNAAEWFYALGRLMLWDDYNHDGSAGRAHTAASTGEPSALGLRLGDAQSDAMISFAGIVPGSVLNWVTMATGLSIIDKHPCVGIMLSSMSVFQHCIDASYPISAVMMNTPQLRRQADDGHDFANFALVMGTERGVDPTNLALGIAILHFMSLPLVFLSTAMYLTSNKERGCPTSILVRHWVQSTSDNPDRRDTLLRLLEECPDMQSLQAFDHAYLGTVDDVPVFVEGYEGERDWWNVVGRIYSFILEHASELDTNSMRRSLSEVTGHTLITSRREIALSVIQGAGILSTLIAPVLRTLGNTIVPTAEPAARVFTVAMPMLLCAGVARAALDVKEKIKLPASSRTMGMVIAVSIVFIAQLVTLGISSAAANDWQAHEDDAGNNIEDFVGGWYVAAILAAQLVALAATSKSITATHEWFRSEFA